MFDFAVARWIPAGTATTMHAMIEITRIATASSGMRLAGGLFCSISTPPSGGLFELYQKAQAAQVPAAQVRCLVDFVQTVIALKLQEYLAAAATPAYEEAARYGHILKVAEAVGAGPDCAAYAGGRAGLHDLIGAVLQAMMGDGADVDGVLCQYVVHLPRERDVEDYAVGLHRRETERQQSKAQLLMISSTVLTAVNPGT